LAAINAMDVGRTTANKVGVEQAEQAAEAAAQQQAAAPQPGQRLITDMLQPVPLNPAQQQRAAAVRQRRQLQEQQQQQRRQQAAAARLAEAQRQAVGRFWELLEDFVVLQAAPRPWVDSERNTQHLVPTSHPFLRREEGALRVHCVAAVPDAS
jgi:small-conductance mechanosensitive channel